MSVSIRGLHIEYPGQLVFDNVDLDVADNEIVAVETDVLDGATSLLKGIAGFLNGVAGTVDLDGVDLLNEPSDEDRFKVGFVYEERGLLSFYNVIQNISLPLQFHSKLASDEIAERVTTACELVGIPEALYLRRPHRLNDVQARLVNLARALAVRPRLLLIDELEGGMSDELVEDTMEILRRHQEEYPMAIIVTTAGEIVLAKADRTFRIDNHTLVESSQS